MSTGCRSISSAFPRDGSSLSPLLRLPCIAVALVVHARPDWRQLQYVGPTAPQVWWPENERKDEEKANVGRDNIFAVVAFPSGGHTHHTVETLSDTTFEDDTKRCRPEGGPSSWTTSPSLSPLPWSTASLARSCHEAQDAMACVVSTLVMSSRRRRLVSHSVFLVLV